MQSEFYSRLQIIDDFSRVGDPVLYKSAPADWWVVVTDVRGSTRAIEQGHYKDVNQLGVATISLVKNLLEEDEFLFVFGGDGATLLLSEQQYSKVKTKLILLEQLASNRFKLDLRVGAVQVRDISQEGRDLQVALLKVNSRQNIAVFLGGGISKADEIIKSRDYPTLPENLDEDPPLQGLSCRWQPLPARKGIIASVLVSTRGFDNLSDVYGEVIAGLNRIFDGDVASANPVNLDQASYKGLLKMATEESRLHRSVFSRGYCKRLLEVILCALGFKLGLPVFRKDRYIAAIPSHSDYKKLDDTLRMVLDCSPGQASEMGRFLDQLYSQGEIFYGIHESPQALMTCVVEGLSDGEHFHFIDGSDGGYAMAAKQMKSQMRSA